MHLEFPLDCPCISSVPSATYSWLTHGTDTCGVCGQSNKNCKLDDLVIQGVGMRYKGVDLIREHLPRTITSLDLSDNAIGERAVVRVKTNKKGEPLGQLNPEYGKSGHTSYGKIKTGVVCIHRETGRYVQSNDVSFEHLLGRHEQTVRL